MPILRGFWDGGGTEGGREGGMDENVSTASISVQALIAGQALVG